MKVLVLVGILICLLNKTAGLNCYACYMNNGLEFCEETKITVSCSAGNKFCLTYKLKDCDDICVENGCDYFEVCKSVGNHETEDPFTGQKVEVDCCEGDLCNNPEKHFNLSSNRSKLTNHSCLFYVLFSSILSSVFVLF